MPTFPFATIIEAQRMCTYQIIQVDSSKGILLINSVKINNLPEKKHEMKFDLDYKQKQM